MRQTPIIIVFLVAFVALILLSLCPWGAWTGGRLKDFNLLGDLMPASSDTTIYAQITDNIDPELKKYIEKPDITEEAVDSILEPESIKEIPLYTSAPVIAGSVVLEDYSSDGSGVSRLKKILEEASTRLVRIAMVGDSYIEGDILAQDIRAGLQNRYGGRGVGYMAAFSPFPGFRASVNQTASNWEEHEIRKMNNDPLRTILGTYFVAQPGADTRFRKSFKPAYLDFWEKTMMVFRADSSGTITFTGPELESRTFEISPSENLQHIELSAVTGDIRITTDVPGLKVLGFWLESDKGISLDDISLRGNSGVSHRILNESTTRQMREFVDYDIIILEFGMNALSSSQSNYSAYGKAMAEVINNLKRLYPSSQILLLGVGDRGQKNGTELGSMPTVKALITAQREAARQTGSLFWDTREAMGGEGAAVDWHERRLVNSDYVHLNHRGGKELADIFLKSLEISIKNNE